MTGDGALRAICRVRELTRSIEPCVLGRSLHAACVSDQEHVEPGEGSCGAMAASGEGVVGKLAHPAESVALIRGEGILHNMIAAILLTLHSLWGLSCRHGQRSSEPVAVDAVVPSRELGFVTACGDGSTALRRAHDLDTVLRARCRVRELTLSIEPCVVGRSVRALCVSDQGHARQGEGSYDNLSIP